MFGRKILCFFQLIYFHLQNWKTNNNVELSLVTWCDRPEVLLWVTLLNQASGCCFIPPWWILIYSWNKIGGIKEDKYFSPLGQCAPNFQLFVCVTSQVYNFMDPLDSSNLAPLKNWRSSHCSVPYESHSWWHCLSDGRLGVSVHHGLLSVPKCNASGVLSLPLSKSLLNISFPFPPPGPLIYHLSFCMR